MALRTKKTCPSASYLSRHEVWMLWSPSMLAQKHQPIGRSKVFVWFLSLSRAQSRPWFQSDLVEVLWLCQHQESPIFSSLPTSHFHRCLVTQRNSSLLVSTCARPFLAVSLLKIPPSIQLSYTFPVRHRSMAIPLWPSNTDLILFITRQISLMLFFSSSATFQLDYAPEHTELFLDQVHANTIGGFLPNTNSPDPNFGKCLQCVAIDRARYRVNPPMAQSSICTQCFQQYCFDPNNLTSASELPGRKFNFVNPDPQGVTALSSFLSRSKAGLILGFVALLLVVAGLSAFLYVCSSLDIRLDPDMGHAPLFVEYGGNVGRARLSTTR